tara:strand:+ start:166 stop:519 length:354 start_codon:yes stop_codon:yes gene_type:complete
MSMNMIGRATEYRVKAGSRATLQLTISDSTGSAKSLTDAVTYSTGVWKVWKPDGTLIINGAITYDDRANGIIIYALTANDTLLANAGNWAGEVELKNSSGVMVEQTQTFNFTIEESY